jgi:hypothetical protein
VTPPSACGAAASARPPPEIRAALLRLYFAPAVRCDAETRAGMRAALPPEALQRIERAGASEWLPAAWEIAMLRSVHARGGDAAVRAIGGEVGRVARDVPVFRPLFAAVLAMLGERREMLVRFLYASLDLSMRNAGRRGAVVGDGKVVRLAHEDLPAASWDRTLNLRNCGAIESLELRGPSPRVDVEWTEGATRAIYVLTWP